jgi:hypothetical protein
VLGGLVWGGAKLAAAAEEHARVMEAVDSYMAARPIKVGSHCRVSSWATIVQNATSISECNQLVSEVLPALHGTERAEGGRAANRFDFTAEKAGI